MVKSIIAVSLFVLIIFISGCADNVQKQDVSDQSLSVVQERGKLIVGTSPPYGPMEFYDASDNIVGIDIDIVKEIASAIGVELEIKDIDFDTLLNSVDAEEIDIAIAAITITPERSSEQLVSIPYFNGGQTIVVRDDETIAVSADLSGRKVGVEDDGTTLKDAILDHVEDPLVQLYKESEGSPYSSTIVTEIKNNAIDAFVIDYVAAVDIVKENPDLKILGEPFTQEFYGIVTKSGNTALMEEINRVVRDMKRTGRLKEIQDAWIS